MLLGSSTVVIVYQPYTTGGSSQCTSAAMRCLLVLLATCVCLAGIAAADDNGVGKPVEQPDEKVCAALHLHTSS